jgi:hypothetical protein
MIKGRNFLINKCGEKNKMNTQNKQLLTKQLFIKALDCPTKMYYSVNPNYVDKTEENEFYQSLQEGGFQVEELARLYHPDGNNLHNPDKIQAIEATKKLLEENSEITLYEASVAYNNCFSRIDILTKRNSNLDLIEVKSKSIKSSTTSMLTKNGFIKAEWKRYLYDIAFQTYLFSNAYPQYTITPYLMLVDTSKTASIDGMNQLIKINREAHQEIKITHTVHSLRKADLGVEILVKIPVQELVELIWKGKDVDPSKKTEEEKKKFTQRIQEYSMHCVNNEKYPITIGAKCKRCEYRISITDLQNNEKSGYVECWKTALNWNEEHFLKYSVLDIWNFRRTQNLLDNNIFFFNEIDLDDNILNPRQKLQIQQAIYNPEQKEFIGGDLSKKLKEFKYPLHFIDFETSRVALPFNKGRRPYELVAFQFSIHTLKKDGSLDHTAEWINEETGIFPNFKFVKQLKANLSKDDGTIFRYSHYENTVLNTIYDQLAEEKENISDASELMEWIRTITEWKENKIKKFGARNMVDMLELVKSDYYHPLMKGSNSIKDVLFAVVNSSDFLKKKYSHFYFGSNFPEGAIWIQKDENSDHYNDPYGLLPPIGGDIIEIKEGGAAMTAYGKLQFTDVSAPEKQEIIKGLLRYCELDTLAMAMIYEHWLSSK